MRNKLYTTAYILVILGIAAALYAGYKPNEGITIFDSMRVEPSVDCNIMKIELPSAPAIEASHPDSNTRWIVPDFNALKQCTDKELLDMAIFCTIGKSTRDANDFVWFGNKLMPERFKVFKAIAPNDVIKW